MQARSHRAIGNAKLFGYYRTWYPLYQDLLDDELMV